MTELRFQTLGSIDLRDRDGAAVDRVLARPKLVAFISYLAIEAHENYVRRDMLTGLFWPRLDEAHARQNLRQVLHELRRVINPDCILTRGNEEIGLSRDVFGCDTTDFQDAIELELLDKALELYRGEFLSGFHLSHARSFSGWLDRTRERFQRMAVETASRRIEMARSAGDVRGALTPAREARDLSPYDESLLRLRVELLMQCGRRAEAIVEYDRFAERLRHDLGIDPAPETTRFVEELSANPVADDAAGRAKPDSGETPATLPTDRPESVDGEAPGPAPRKMWRAAAVTLALTLGALATVSVVSDGSRGASPALDRRLIAALPFDTRGASLDLEPWGAGLVHLLYNTLASSPGTRLAYPPTSFDLWSDGAGAPEAADSTAMGVALRLGAGRLLRGSLVGDRDGLLVQAELMRVPDGATLASPSVRGSLDELPALIQRLAVEILAAGESFAPDEGLAEVSTDALEHFVRGLQAFRQEKWLAAAEHHRSALEADSSFAAPALQMLLAAQRTTRGPAWLRDEPWEVAWALKDRMTEADRAHVIAIEGPAGPGEPVTAAELIQAAEDAVAAASDRPQILETLARSLLYYGQAVGIEDWADLAAEAADRALQLTDRPFYRLVGIRMLLLGHESLPDSEKAARARAILDRFGRPEWPGLPFLAWVATGDTAYFTTFEREGLPALGVDAVNSVAGVLTQEGLPTTAWRIAVDSLERRGLLPSERLAALYQRFLLTATEGRPTEAAPKLRTLVESRYEEFWGVWWFLRTPIHRALVEPGWDEAAAWAASRIPNLPDSLIRDPWPEASRTCHLGLSDVVEGDLARASERLMLTRARSEGPLHCALLLEALIENGGRPGDSNAGRAASVLASNQRAGAVEALDERMQRLPLEPEAWITNAVLARIWWERGDAVRAFAAARRRGQSGFWQQGGGVPVHMLIEARAAAALGDSSGAIAAYEQYLRLRREPDESMQAVVDSARHELRALLGGRPSAGHED